MERIMSTKNEYVKELRSLRLAKYRRECGKFLAEGRKCAEEALRYAPVEALLFLEGQEDASLLALAAEQGARQIAVSPAVMEAVSEAKSPQGMAAVVRRGGDKPFLPAGVLVALEDVADPTNVGAIVRTADAIGAAGVLLSAGCADATSPRAVRASMGSLFHVPVRVAEDFPAALSALKGEGWRMVGGHLRGQDRLCPAEKSCLLIGNEARGLTPAASALCDDLVKITIYGQAESLNASVAAGILLYRLREGF